MVVDDQDAFDLHLSPSSEDQVQYPANSNLPLYTTDSSNMTM